jgi:hypothetical protein
MLRNINTSLIDLNMLMAAFGIMFQPGTTMSPENQRQLAELLLDEFHARLHSHAPQSLIDHCRRRNAWWYLANTSAVASLVGCVVAIIILGYGDHLREASCKNVVGIAVSIGIFVAGIPLALTWVGDRWHRQFWGVCWTWIRWDRQTHNLPHEWLATLPNGVQWIPNPGGQPNAP